MGLRGDTPGSYSPLSDPELVAQTAMRQLRQHQEQLLGEARAYALGQQQASDRAFQQVQQFQQQPLPPAVPQQAALPYLAGSFAAGFSGRPENAAALENTVNISRDQLQQRRQEMLQMLHEKYMRAANQADQAGDNARSLQFTAKANTALKEYETMLGLAQERRQFGEQRQLAEEQRTFERGQTQVQIAAQKDIEAKRQAFDAWREMQNNPYAKAELEGRLATHKAIADGLQLQLSLPQGAAEAAKKLSQASEMLAADIQKIRQKYGSAPWPGAPQSPGGATAPPTGPQEPPIGGLGPRAAQAAPFVNPFAAGPTGTVPFNPAMVGLGGVGGGQVPMGPPAPPPQPAFNPAMVGMGGPSFGPAPAMGQPAPRAPVTGAANIVQPPPGPPPPVPQMPLGPPQPPPFSLPLALQAPQPAAPQYGPNVNWQNLTEAERRAALAPIPEPAPPRPTPPPRGPSVTETVMSELEKRGVTTPKQIFDWSMMRTPGGELVADSLRREGVNLTDLQTMARKKMARRTAVEDSVRMRRVNEEFGPNWRPTVAPTGAAARAIRQTPATQVNLVPPLMLKNPTSGGADKPFRAPTTPAIRISTSGFGKTSAPPSATGNAPRGQRQRMTDSSYVGGRSTLR